MSAGSKSKLSGERRRGGGQSPAGCRSHQRRHAARLGACLTAAAALLAAGCSSATSSSVASGASSASPAAATTTCLTQAKALVAKAQGPFQQQYPAPFNASSVKGKTFWVISFSQALPSVVGYADGFVAAAKSVGAKTVVFDGQGNPALFNQGVDNAVGQHAAGILLLGFSGQLVSAAVARAGAAKVPVVDAVGTNANAPLIPGLTGHSTFNFTDEGSMQGDYIASATGCKADSLMFYVPASPATEIIAMAAQAELKQLCPTTCSMTLEPLDGATMTTTAAPQLENLLQKSPGINFVGASSDSLVPYLLQGEKALHKVVPIIGTTGSTLAAAQQGNAEVADVIWPPQALMGYMFFAAMLEATKGLPNEVSLGLRLMDKSNWGTNVSEANLYPGLGDWQAKFQQLWSGS
jgi:ribose transport system substrate-binding protein